MTLRCPCAALACDEHGGDRLPCAGDLFTQVDHHLALADEIARLACLRLERGGLGLGAPEAQVLVDHEQQARG